MWSDDFNRAGGVDTSDIGSDWNEVAGDWGIKFTGIDGMLYEAVGGGGTAGAKVLGTNPAPIVHPGEMSFGVTVINPQVDDVFYLYPCCTDSSTIGPVTCTYTYKGSNVWETQIDADTPVEQLGSNIGSLAVPEFTLGCCADHQDEFVKAYVGSVGDEFSWNVALDPGTGRYYGLGHNNTTNGATFDDFAVLNLRDKGRVICAECWCMCDHTGVPRDLTATIVASVSATNRAACLNGLTWSMTWLWVSPIGEWHGSITVTRGIYSHTIYFTLYCETWAEDQYPGENWELVWAVPVSVCSDGQSPLGAGPTSTCDPLSLVFGPYVLDATNLGCYLCYDPCDPSHPDYDPGPPISCGTDPMEGEFYIVITL